MRISWLIVARKPDFTSAASVARAIASWAAASARRRSLTSRAISTPSPAPISSGSAHEVTTVPASSPRSPSRGMAKSATAAGFASTIRPASSTASSASPTPSTMRRSRRSPLVTVRSSRPVS